MKPTKAQRLEAAKMRLDGTVVASHCRDCGSPVAGCDYRTDTADPKCGQEAYKWVEGPAGSTVYFCESHGHIPEFLVASGFVSEWAAYMPGPEGCSCDWPY